MSQEEASAPLREQITRRFRQTRESAGRAARYARREAYKRTSPQTRARFAFLSGLGRRLARLYALHWPPALAATILVMLVVVLLCNSVVRPGLANTPQATLAPTATATILLTPTVGATPTATPKPISKDQANKLLQALQLQYTVNYYLSQMSLDEKVGQMIMFETTSTEWDSSMAATVSSLHAGAMIIYGKNMKTKEQLTKFIADAQAHTKIPMFITTDEEGGNVDRLAVVKFNDPLPSAQYLGNTGDPAHAYDAGSRAAAELAAYGINVDLAPVVDVKTVANQVEGPRLYGSTPQKVDSYAGQFLLGLQDHGIIGTLKHWPGIGSTTQDPHLTLPVINRSKADLESIDFAAFKGLLKDQPGMIMVTHVQLNAIDPDLPSSLSPKVVQGVLRDELGYQGVVVTDDLWMDGISNRFSLGEAAVRAILAGDDLIEGPWSAGTMQTTVSAIKSAIKSGRIPMARVNQAVERLLRLKVQYGMLPMRTPPAAQQKSGDSAPFGLTAAYTPVADQPRRAALA